MPKVEKKRRSRAEPQNIELSSEEDLGINPEFYSKQREKNNEAVKKSRERSKRSKVMSQQRVEQLEESNKELQGAIVELKNDLSHLKQIFVQASTGAPGSSVLTREEILALLVEKPEHEEVPETKYDQLSSAEPVSSDDDLQVTK
ncbi:CCAAT/enhancer-binding protein gamma-like isoform X2 [Artemia franciscana]|nr:hypothetical protein QYM36_017532 [Artemia franciscana]